MILNWTGILFASALSLGATAAVSCPDFRKSGDTYKLSGQDMYNEKLFKVQAGGKYDIRYCDIHLQSDTGRGFVTSRPDFTVQTSGMGNYSLVVSVVSECDSVVLVNTGAANWYYDDDDNGNLDARITLTRPSNGWLDIWVGTQDGATCDAILSLETF